MPQSSRSVVVPLATNLHLAFDATLMRTHTVWQGQSLDLYGPPFNGTSTRFMCDYSGTRIWGSLPRVPWSFGGLTGSATGVHFKGISTIDGRPAFIYELSGGDSGRVRITETPQIRPVGGHDIVVRHFEIGPAEQSIVLTAHDQPGEPIALPGSAGALGISSADGVLIAVLNGLPAQRFTGGVNQTPVVEQLWTERDGKGPYSALVTNRTADVSAVLQVTVPPGREPRVFEVASTLCADLASAEALAKVLVTAPLKRSDATGLQNKIPSAVFLPNPGSTDKSAGDDFYTVEHFPVPPEIKLTVAGMDFLPNGNLVVATFQGEVFIVEGATGKPKEARWRRFARGLNEPGGLRVISGDIYVMQKCELTRLRDRDGDGTADTFECVSDAWGYTGNYHSFATGPIVDAQGNFYALITGHRPIREVSFMGWCLKITPDSRNTPADARPAYGDSWSTGPFCSGLRVPNGFGEYRDDLFMTDNQGHWIAANKLNHLRSGQFYGYPSASPSPLAQLNGDTNFTPPAVWFPYAWVRSTSGIASITTERFGPFAGQMLVGEFQNAAVFRVALEQVNGQWQGAVFPFVKGFASGVNRIAFSPDGRLYAGGLRLGHWTSIAPQPHALDRVSFTGKVPFEIREIHVTANGFVLQFTRALDAASAANLESWDALQYTYAYDGRHNAPEKDRDEKILGPPVRITKAEVAADKLSVRLMIEGLKPRHVILLRAADVLDSTGVRLRNDTCHYTLNQIPR